MTDKEKLERIEWAMMTFCAGCEYFDGRQFGPDLKDDTVCENVCPHLFRKIQKRVLDIIKGKE